MQSVDWKFLQHAYGDAANVPALLQAAAVFPAEVDWRSEPWFSLWSSLCHQGEIYSASIAAVPFLVDCLKREPSKATLSFILLPVSIAIADSAEQVGVSAEVREAFSRSLVELSAVSKSILPTLEDVEMRLAAEAAILVARGAFSEASSLLEQGA